MHSKVLLCFGIDHGIHPGQSHRIRDYTFGFKSQNQISQCGQRHQAQLGSEDSGQNQDGQCNQCLHYLGSRDNQDQDGQYSQCCQNHFGSMNSGQNQDGPCSQCEEDFGSTGQIMDSQSSHFLPEPRLGHTEEENQISQCSQCHYHQESRLGHTGEESWVNQFSQDSDSWGAGWLPTHMSTHLSQSHPFDSRGAGWQPTHWSAWLSQGLRAKVRIMDSVKFDVNFGLNFGLSSWKRE
eukprot:53473-Amphidinium_carterae.2